MTLGQDDPNRIVNALMVGSVKALLDKHVDVAGKAHDNATDPQGIADLRQELGSGGWLELFGVSLLRQASVSPDTALAVAEEFGESLLPISLTVTFGFAMPLAMLLGSHSEHAMRIIELLRAGDEVAIPIPSAASIDDSRLVSHLPFGQSVSNGWEISGSIPRVIVTDAARELLVPFRLPSGKVGLGSVPVKPLPKGVSLDYQRAVLGDTLVGSLTLDRVVVSVDSLVTDHADQAWSSAYRIYSLLLDAQTLGNGRALLNRTIEYVKARQQFGRSIGGFQAIQHMVADMCILLESSRSIAYAAARAFSQDQRGTTVDILVSRVYVSDQMKHLCEMAIQAHGGVGFTWELGLHQWYRAVLFSRHYLSDVLAARAMLAEGLKQYIGSDTGH